MKSKLGKALSAVTVGLLLAGAAMPSARGGIAKAAASETVWQDAFLYGGKFNTSAPGFPDNYTFNIVKTRTLQNASNVVSLKKGLFNAIRESGKTVVLKDNTASYVIKPSDVKSIPESQFNQTVDIGSYYRTGTSYPPAARTIASGYGAIASDAQYLMGRHFVFWQMPAFPTDVLTSCEVRLEVTNAGMSEAGADIASASAAASLFRDYARNNTLYAYIYSGGAAATSTEQRPAPSEGKSISFSVNSPRTWLLTCVNFKPSDATKTAAAGVVSKINAIPASGSSRAAAVSQARAAYDALTPSAKALVGNDSKLFAAEVEELIARIPDKVSAADETAVLNARFAYNALTPLARGKVGNRSKLEKAETEMAALLNAVRVACVGDSITKGLSYSSNPDTNSYPALLQKQLGLKFTVRNFGVGGSTMLKKGDKPYWNQPEFAASAAFNPKIVIIMLGTNDAKPKNWAYKSEFAADLKAMVQHYRALPSKPAVYVATSATAYFNAMNVTDATISGEVVALQKSAAAALGCPVIDVNAATKNNEALFTDGIHPNNDGYAVIAQTMAAALRNFVNVKLSDLKIDGKTLTGFNPAVYEYTVELPAGSAKIPAVSAVAQASGAKVTVSQAGGVGKAATITVTAESGDKQVYTVRFVPAGSAPAESKLVGSGGTNPASRGPESGNPESKDPAGPGSESGEPVAGNPESSGSDPAETMPDSSDDTELAPSSGSDKGGETPEKTGGSAKYILLAAAVLACAAGAFVGVRVFKSRKAR